MYVFDLWLVVAIVPTVGLVQWWATRRIHRKHLAVARARYLSAQHGAAKMLQQSRQQITQLQQELAAARLSARRVPRATPPSPARVSVPATRDDASRRAPALPVDGFAETMPSLQFSHTSAFGPL